MMKRLILISLVLIAGMLLFYAFRTAPRRNLQHKEVFSKGFPKTLSFRNDKLGLGKSYGFWENVHAPFNSITKKYLQEEVDMPPVFARWANKYVQDHPEKLMLIHLNGEGRSVNDKEMHKRYFPGHWIYEAGSYPSEDIAKEQTTIKLSSAKPFSERAYTVHGRNVKIDKLPHDLIMIEIDGEGNRLWDKYEYATIEKVDYANNEITVRRGQYQTKARNFSKERTYLAPLAGDSWGGNLMWYYNLSSTCPLDKNGNSCADVFVSEMNMWFGPGGTLENFDGIGFDVNYFESDHETWDCNNDGLADRGFVDGKNIWRLGDLDFLQKIRFAFGPEFIITADGWRDEMQRAVGLMNGMETEGLCRWNDGYRQISRTINQHRYWNLHNHARYQYSYITSKLRNPDDSKISTQLHRMGMALASCLDVAYAYSAPLFIPEAVGGILNTANWLGQPVSELKYTAKDTDDLLHGMGIEMNTTFVEQFDFSHADHRVDQNELYIKGQHKNPYEELVIPGPEIKIPSGDLIIFFEARAIQGFTDLGDDNAIPRKINVRIEGLPDYPPEPLNTHLLHNDLAGFMGTAGYTPQMFYYRNAGRDRNSLRIIFEVEEQGEFVLRNISVHNAPATMVRQFEHGMVLVNPAYDSYTFNLAITYPGLGDYHRIQIDKTKTENLDGQINEVAAYNNGEAISDLTSVQVPGLNALFLVETKP